MHVAVHIFIRRTDPFGRTDNVVVGEYKLMTSLQQDTVFFGYVADSDFRSLQILEDT